jgi:hypothetical protein
VVPNEKRDARGSIAAIMPVGVDFIEPLVFMETEFVGQLAGQNTPNLHRPLVVGDEWNGALVGYIDDILPIVPEYQRTLEEFSFFGDPDTLTTLVPPLAEYEVALQAIPKFASLGDAITVRVRVKAQDIGDEARALVAQVNLPAGMQYNGASPTVGSVSHNDGVILWNVGSLVPGVEVALDVQVLVLPEANLPFQVTSSVTAITPDFDPANNSAALTIGPPPEVVDSIEIY